MSVETWEAEAARIAQAPRVTIQHIKASIKDVEYIVRGTLTIAIVTLTNGYRVTGESATMNPLNYNKKFGEEKALDGAYQKIWGLLAFQRLGEISLAPIGE